MQWLPDRGLLEYERGLLEYTVIAGGTGGGDVVVGAHEAQVHGQQRAAHVGYGKWYTEGVHLAVGLHHTRPDISGEQEIGLVTDLITFMP